MGVGIDVQARVVRQRLLLVGSPTPYRLPAWFATGVPTIFVEGHVLVRPGEGDGVAPSLPATCDSAPCRPFPGPDDLAWSTGEFGTVSGRVPASGKVGLMAPPWTVAERDSYLELVLSVGWRPDSVQIPISVRAIIATAATAQAGPAEDRPALTARGLRGTIRRDLVEVMPAPRQSPGRGEVLRDLCGGRPVATPAWAEIPRGAFVLQDDATDTVRDFLGCLRQDREAEAWNLWRPDSDQRLLDTARVLAAPVRPDTPGPGDARFLMVDHDLPPSLVAVAAGALGVDSIWRTDTGQVSWYLLRRDSVASEWWSSVSDQLARIVGSGGVIPPMSAWRGDNTPRVVPDSAWRVSQAVADLVHGSIRGVIRGIQEDRVAIDTAVAAFTVFYGDSTRCLDLSCNYPRMSGLRVGARVGWLETSGWMTRPGEVGGGRSAFAGRWPADTALLDRLERLATLGQLPWEGRGAISDLRVGLLEDPRATAEWRHRLVVAHRAEELGDAVDSALCRRAAKDRDYPTLIDLATRGADRPLGCAVHALSVFRENVLGQARIPSEVLLYYATEHEAFRRRDTLAMIAWRRRDWAVLGVTGPPREFHWADSVTRALQLPPEAGVEGCLGAWFRQVESDGCNALTAYALRSGDPRLLHYLANRRDLSVPGAMDNWILINRRLRGDPLRAWWDRSWVDD